MKLLCMRLTNRSQWIWTGVAAVALALNGCAHRPAPAPQASAKTVTPAAAVPVATTEPTTPQSDAGNTLVAGGQALPTTQPTTVAADVSPATQPATTAVAQAPAATAPAPEAAVEPATQPIAMTPPPPSAVQPQPSSKAPANEPIWTFPRTRALLRNLTSPRQEDKRMIPVTQSEFGTTKDGKPVILYTLTNKNGLIAKVMTYGATLTQMITPDRIGHRGDIVLGFDHFQDYEARSPFFGATTGRVANRIANATFDLDGQTYDLAANNGPNTLHGGKVGFDKKIWDATVLATSEGPSVEFHYVSPDLEENFPGTLDVTVTYTLTQHDELRIDYKATTDKDTIINLTNHSYWNLSAFKSPNILGEIMYINADRYTPVDENLIPTGRLKSVFNSPFDFTVPTRIGDRINNVPGGPPAGYDHNYVLNGQPGALKLCARVSDPETGRRMQVQTTEPGVQFYTGNFLDGSLIGHHGNRYVQHAGFCLETQHYPDSIHHPEFPTTILKPGQLYTQTTIYAFSTYQ